MKQPQTRRHKSASKRKTRTKKRTNSRSHRKTGKKWTTAIEAAQKTLEETRSLAKARISLRKQALTNARKLFGSVGTL